MELTLTEIIKPLTICLNMIVKNESKIIERMFTSVLPIIDTYCICDTGSTDNTAEVITNFFNKHNITGKIVYEPFVNFCHNRTFALKSCLGMSDYVLLMDADMILQIRDFDKNKLRNFSAFHILQGSDAFYYKNIRIVKNSNDFEYFGVTHEYLNIPNGNTIESLEKNEIFILDIGDGGCKDDKVDRDIRLLTKGIENEPNNARYYFYLANSYHDKGEYENAIPIYKKRIELAQWNEEIWYSYYRIGLCHKRLNRISEAINAWLDAYNIIPNRLENIYEIINHYRWKSKYELANLFYLIAKNILYKAKNNDDHLFHQNDIYTYKIYNEYTIFSYYVGNTNINNEVIKILNICNDGNDLVSLFKNMKFYKDILKHEKKISFNGSTLSQFGGIYYKFVNSSSCIINDPKEENKYLLNIRIVNYHITDNGSYINCDKHIITNNIFYSLDKLFNVNYEKKFIVEYNENKRYLGIEDIKIYNDQYSNKIKFIGTCLCENGNLGIGYGNYEIDNKTLIHDELKSSFNNNECEKNWVYFDYMNKTHIIYNWFPLTICSINMQNNSIEILEKKDMPLIFSHIRGSSCGYTYKNEIWFITHLVSYENPRHYYHLIIVFDKNMKLLRYTAPFKFEGEPIEYSLSILVEDTRVLITYSTWDRTSNIGVYSKDYIESKLVY